MNTSRTKNKGFTLIELMIVVAIMSLLVALSLPAYMDYVVRAKVAEGIQLASAAKLATEETCQTDSTIDITTQSGYAFSASTYVETIQIMGNCANIIVLIQTRNTGADADPIILLSKASSPGLLTFLGRIGIPVGRSPSWGCFVGANSMGYVPANCRWQPSMVEA